MLLLINIAGVLLIVLAFVHVIFPRYFSWTTELGSLSLINRQMMYVHSFFIALTVLLMGLLCITSSEELSGTGLGKKLAFGLCVFWGIRLIIQFFGYSPRLWRGKKFETTIHILASMLWAFLCLVFFFAFWL